MGRRDCRRGVGAVRVRRIVSWMHNYHDCDSGIGHVALFVHDCERSPLVIGVRELGGRRNVGAGYGGVVLI